MTTQKNASNADGEMSVAAHLRELRRRLLTYLGALAVCLLFGLRYAPELTRRLLSLGEAYSYRFVYLSPEELLLEYLRISLAASFCVTLPGLLYEIWMFLRPGLRRDERLAVLVAMLSGTLCAALGAAFAYRIMTPFVLRFLFSLSDGIGVASSVSVRSYLSFLLTQLAVFAAVFELPVILAILTWFGLVRAKTLRRLRKPIIVLCFLLAAIITPPDPFSQIMVAVPLLLLFELSIALCSLLEKRHGKMKSSRRG
ncbi:MAG: twin-arginine translocase subunit TatC [Oscillospiraceae bacterium]|nr:twin-arginine translocase subunit TatC [Oscillospiraceae bacterium]